MKKILLASLVTVLGISSVFAQSTQMKAVVSKVSGKAEVFDEKNNAWSKIEVGNELEKGAMIQTGFKAELELKIKGSVVNVAPLSRLTLEQLVAKDTKDETRIYLETGSLKSSVNKMEDRSVGFKVRSPVATASVRGTVFEVKNKFKSTDVKTHEGSVAVWKESPKNKNKGAQVATAEEDNTPAVLPGTGNSASDISDGAPSNAFTVTKGQTVGFQNNGTTASAQSNAVSVAVSLPTTETASSTESEKPAAAPVTHQPPAQVTNPVVVPVPPKKGGISVKPVWK